MEYKEGDEIGRPLPIDIYFRSIKKNIISMMAIFITFFVLSLLFSFFSSEVYKTEVSVFPNEELGSIQSGGIDSSGIAALDFLGASKGGDLVSEHLAILNSREFLRKFLEKRGLTEKVANYRALREGEPTEQRAVARFKRKVLSVQVDRLSGQITLSIHWDDAQQSAILAADLVSDLNNRLRQDFLKNSESRLEYLEEKFLKETVSERRSVLLRLIEKEEQKRLLANAQTEFAFRVVDPSYVPDGPVSPNHFFNMFVGSLIGLVVGALYVTIKYKQD